MCVEKFLNKFLIVLDVDPRNISIPTGYREEDMIYRLLVLEDYFPEMKLERNGRTGEVVINLQNKKINEFLYQWGTIRGKKKQGMISEDEYMQWKYCRNHVIFITENDVLGENLPIYHVDRIIRETGKMFNDESHIVYVNSQIKDETALGKLMHDFACTNAKDMCYEVLADRVHYFKEDEKGVAVMCKAMEDMRNEAAKMKAVHIARLMLDGGKLSYEDIAAYTELTIEEVEKIASEKKSA